MSLRWLTEKSIEGTSYLLQEWNPDLGKWITVPSVDKDESSNKSNNED